MLGSFGRGQMVPEFDDVIFNDATEVGKILEEPVKTQFGYHVITVSKRGNSAMARASHILVEDEAKAQELKDKIGSDMEEFVKLAKAESKCPSGKQGGKLGEFSTGQMVPEFETVVFNPDTNVGEIIGPVKTEFGFHLLVVTDRVDADAQVAADSEEKQEATEEPRDDDEL